VTDKREYREYEHRRELEAAGWKVRQRDAVAFNSGSETVRHAVCKMLVCYKLKERGFRVDTEVGKEQAGEIDIVAYGVSDEPAFAVEVETNPTKDVVSDKIARYHDNEPFRDVFILNVSEMPKNILNALAWVEEQL
jgi:hypothetical protein